MASFRLSRRTVLRGLGLGGISIALPTLDAMLDDRGNLYRPARAQPGVPVYFLTFFVPNGMYPETWWPSGDGASYAPSRCLEPLEPFRSELSVLQNLRKDEAYRGQDIDTDAHARGHASFATGGSLKSSTQLEFPSVDQVIADHIGTETRIRSLPVALGGVRPPVEATQGYISWRASGDAASPVLAERNPVKLFELLFSDFTTPPPTDTPLVDYRQSILDYVKDDISRLSPRLGAHDQARLEAHLTAIRELERRIVPGGTPGGGPASCSAPARPDSSHDFDAPGIDDTNGGYSNERCRLLMELQVLAFACDLTRVGSFQMANRRNKRQFPWLNATDGADGHHGISHDSSSEGYEKQTKIVIDEMEQFAYLLGLLQAQKQGDRDLLHNTIVFFAHEHGHGEAHDFKNVPVIIAGRGGGTLEPGGHIRYPANTPYSNVFVTLLNAMGIARSSFGAHGTAPLPGLTT